MMQYDFGIIILCSSLNVRDLVTTMSTLRHYVDESKIISIIPTSDTKVKKQFQSVCKTYRCKNTTESCMINKGMHFTESDWNLLIISGKKVKSNIFHKLILFNTIETDVLFPCTVEHTNFLDTSLSWLCIHKNCFKKVGHFSEGIDEEHSKILWTTKAIDLGCDFKGVLGVRTV